MPMAPPANSTWAIGTPVARLFFEPQKTMVMRSATSKPSSLPNRRVRQSTIPSSTQQTTTRPSSAVGGTCCQRPWTTAALNAV